MLSFAPSLSANVPGMCGRYVSSSPPDQLAAYFGATAGEALPGPNFNVAPSLDAPVVIEHEGERLLEAFQWGLIPFWAKDPKIANKLINARAEGLASKNPFRNAFSRRRCLVPADGFYEWVKIEGEKKKQPVYITRPDGQPFAFAGLWESWTPPGQDLEVFSFTIVTCAPNTKMSKLHHRMPAMLEPQDWPQWLSRDLRDTDKMSQLLVPAADSVITFRAVSTDVNNARNEGEHLIEARGEIDVVPTELVA